MKVNSIMTKDVITVDMDTSLKAIGTIFDDVQFHHLLVMEDDELWGVVSDRDLLKASSPFVNTFAEQRRDVIVMRKRAHQVMSRKPVTITEQANPQDAARLMLREDISCLPVLSSDGLVVGILTRRDLLRAYSQHT